MSLLYPYTYVALFEQTLLKTKTKVKMIPVLSYSRSTDVKWLQMIIVEIKVLNKIDSEQPMA